MTWLAIWAFVKAYKSLFIYGACAVLIGTSVVYYGHTRYEAGKEIGVKIATQAKLELATEVKAHETDRVNYRAAQAVVAESNQKEVARLEAVITKNNKDFRAKYATLLKKQEVRRVQENDAYRVSDVVTFPHNFWVLYNSAIGDHPGYQASETKDAYRSGPSSKIDSVGASAFSKVMLRNVDKYNDLAARCDKLVDQVIDREKSDEDPNNQKP